MVSNSGPLNESTHFTGVTKKHTDQITGPVHRHSYDQRL